MADNVSYTPGSGATIAADDVGSGVLVQRVKLVLGADGANDGDVADGAPMPTKGYAFDIKTSITRPADTNVYAAGDAFADSTSAPTSGGFSVASAARASGKGGIITDVLVTSSNNAATTLQRELWIFDQAVTAVNDNAAISLSDGDILNLVAVIPFLLAQETNNSWAHLTGLSIGFVCSGSANLRFLVKVKNAYTPASAEVLQVRAKGVQTN